MEPRMNPTAPPSGKIREPSPHSPWNPGVLLRENIMKAQISACRTRFVATYVAPQHLWVSYYERGTTKD